MLRVFTKTLKIYCISLLLIIPCLAQGDKTIIVRPEELFVSDVPFFDAEGNKVYLDQYEGKTILLAFWATWCGTCISEMPSLDVLQKDFRKLPFEVIAVSEDFQGIGTINKHFRENGIRHLKIFHDRKNKLLNSMSVAGLPTSFLIDPDGKVRIIFKGFVKWHSDKIRDMILSEIDSSLERPKNTYKEVSLDQRISVENEESQEELEEEDGDENKKEHKKRSKW